MTTEISSAKGRIVLETKAEVKLRQWITVLTKRCNDMKPTISSLDKVRDVIQIIGNCPGLSRPEFHIPLWVGRWVYRDEDFDLETYTDKEIDAQLDAFCKGFGYYNGFPVRSAETSEIIERTIEGIPEKNSATLALMAKCPNCEGKDDEAYGVQHKSGHARICWDKDKDLGSTYRNDCETGRKAVMCVVDRGNMRNLPDLSA